MRIDSSGNVGIGVTSPGEKLDVDGNINIRTTAGGVRGIKRNDNGYNLHLAGGSSLTDGSYIEVNGGSRGGVGNALNGEINFVSGGSYQSSQSAVVGNYNFKTQWNGGSATLMHSDSSSGNVGIGTTSPQEELHIASTVPVIRLEDTDGGYAQIVGSNGSLSLRSDQANTVASSIIDFTIDNSEKMRINSSGNVGIGTTSPSHKLDVDGGAQFNTNTGATPFYITRLGSTNESLKIYTGDTGSVFETIQDETTGTYGSMAFKLDAGAPSPVFSFEYGSTVRTVIEGGTGNVGIGTTSPSYKLSVLGGVLAGGKATYTKSYSSLDTTGNAVAGLESDTNGRSSLFTFTCFGHTGGYQKIVYSCYNAGGTWNTKKVIDEGTNDFDVEASANAATITFTFKSTSGTKSYSPKVIVEASGSAINSTYA
jgi:hypothetical protein